uniref:Iron complex outermembrane recepter protein n=1 Tax=Candidatus Kentrum sp. SD TaxID=2126332 RepID=A0A450Z5S6_9GAMM|nr:MAG: iron complex outermembrane recepter protein [Candidatus Kentron sp. SD]VFK49141.1 MAG: iron complex outermembrane recepter protein [Candidatus Kentron sp. SD]VFK80746.1 MAG: iron complex outermembrane recepter protein [Candidatus Kentron sp. SD]
MKNLLGLIPILSLCVSTEILGETSPDAKELSPIHMTADIIINPNIAEPTPDRREALSADGGDFLRQLNGISVGRFGGRGLEPIIRGQSQTRLNVLLDGAYIHGGCPNRMDPPTSWAAIETYESVTVLKGVQSLIHGGGGSGGTVLFERDTRGLAEARGIHGRVSAIGSDNGARYDVLGDLVASGESGYLRTFAEIKDAENYQDGQGREIRSAYEHRQGGIVFGLTPTKSRLLEFTYEQNDFSDALYPGAAMDSPEEKGDIYRLRYVDAFETGPVNDMDVRAYFSDVDHLMNNFDLRAPPNYASGPNVGQPMLRETPTTSRTMGIRAILSTGFHKTDMEYGMDLQRNERDAVLNNRENGVKALSFLWPDADIQQYGIFAEATTSLSERSNVKYGLRVDHVKRAVGKADDKPAMVSPNTAYDTYYGIRANAARNEINLGGLFRYTRELTPEITAFVGISRSARTADATELFMNKWHSADPSQRWVGNPGLEPEKHHQIDIGLTRKDRRYEVNAVAFHDDVTDYILRDTARGQSGILLSDNADIYRNVDATLHGLELDGRFDLTEHIELGGSLAYARATNTTDDRPIAKTPPLNGKFHIDYDTDHWRVGAQLRFATEQDRIDEISKQEVGKTSGWAVFDIHGIYRINDALRLSVGIDNLWDKTYAEHASRSNLLDPTAIKVNEPGRIFWLKTRAEF